MTDPSVISESSENSPSGGTPLQSADEVAGNQASKPRESTDLGSDFTDLPAMTRAADVPLQASEEQAKKSEGQRHRTSDLALIPLPHDQPARHRDGDAALSPRPRRPSIQLPEITPDGDSTPLSNKEIPSTIFRRRASKSERLEPIKDTNTNTIRRSHSQALPAVTLNQLDADYVAKMGAQLRAHRRWLPSTLPLMAGDLLAWSVSFMSAILVRQLAGGTIELSLYLNTLPFITAMGVVVYAWLGLYQTDAPPPANELKRLVRANTILFLALAAGTFLIKEGSSFSRVTVVMTWALALGLTPLMRYAVRTILARIPYFQKSVLVVGDGLTAVRLVKHLQRDHRLGLRPVAVVGRTARPGDFFGLPIVGPRRLTVHIAKAAGIESVIIAQPSMDQDEQVQLTEELADVIPDLTIIPQFYGIASLWVDVRDLDGMLGLKVSNELLKRSRRIMKRSLDLLLVGVVSVFAALPMLGIGLVVKLTSKGPMLYGQLRIGQNGKRIRVWKFRSMIPNGDAMLAAHLEANPAAKAEWEADHKLKSDPRVTWIGGILRTSSLDELPQLWNVLVGEMSLVGPRPITGDEISKYGGFYRYYSTVRPGVTGLWQVSGRNLTTYDERIGFDAYYARNWSVYLDIYILARTVKTVLFREGAF